MQCKSLRYTLRLKTGTVRRAQTGRTQAGVQAVERIQVLPDLLLMAEQCRLVGRAQGHGRAKARFYARISRYAVLVGQIQKTVNGTIIQIGVALFA